MILLDNAPLNLFDLTLQKRSYLYVFVFQTYTYRFGAGNIFFNVFKLANVKPNFNNKININNKMNKPRHRPNSHCSRPMPCLPQT